VSLATIAVVSVCGVLGFGIAMNIMSGNANEKLHRGEADRQPTKETPHSRRQQTASSQRQASDQAYDGSAEWHKPTPNDWESVLGIDSTTPPAAIRSAYLKLVQQYHPDRFSSAAPEIVKYADKKTKAINAAYLTAQRLDRV